MRIEHSINKSVKIDRLEFSNREDYVEYFIRHGIVKSEYELWSNSDLVSLMHRHWHGEGRNGCIFALLAARKAEDVGWDNFVITEKINEFSIETKNKLYNKLENAINSQQCQVLSLLFSNITTTADLVELIKWLLSFDIIQLKDKEIFGDWITLALRIPIKSDNVLSWLMGFGPFEYFPQTRQSPILEIAIRVKEKSEKIFHRLNDDREAAHLADINIGVEDRILEKIWVNTLKRTRIILGEEPNHFSAARTTFVLPKNSWK